jgi:hypothetical protein
VKVPNLSKNVNSNYIKQPPVFTFGSRKSILKLKAILSDGAKLIRIPLITNDVFGSRPEGG